MGIFDNLTSRFVSDNDEDYDPELDDYEDQDEDEPRGRAFLTAASGAPIRTRKRKRMRSMIVRSARITAHRFAPQAIRAAAVPAADRLSRCVRI